MQNLNSNIPWDKILRSIHNKQILPIIGPGLHLVQAGEKSETFQDWLAPRLAEKLNLELPPNTTLNSVVSHGIMAGQRSPHICSHLSKTIDDYIQSDKLSLPQPLLDLASIRDLDIFISSAFDPLLSLALEQERPEFSYKDGGFSSFLLKRQKDIPEVLPATYVYHILGSYSESSYAIWEEDYLEYICALVRTNRDNHPNLYDLLQERSLLLIGSPFTDWVVRFFLRAATGQKLSHRANATLDYLADEPRLLNEPMVFFFNNVLQTPQIISSSLPDFTAELASRWREKYLDISHEGLLNSIPDDMEKNSIFISYSNDDLEIAITLATGLRQAGLPVWLDKKRLNPGSDWETHLMRAVKSRASLFISLISQATENDPDRFVHTERKWAADKHIPGNIFYIPVIIDDTVSPSGEPLVFKKCQYHTIPDGVITQNFASLLQKYYKTFIQKGEVIDA